MKYRKFGKLDFEVSALGFGCMRLPGLDVDNTRATNNPNINEPEAIAMIRHAIDHGVNYLDTAAVYHGGNSERVLGKALQDGYREKVKVATKMPVWTIKCNEDLDKTLNEQLQKLQTGHIDFYLLHGLRQASLKKIEELKILEWAEKALADGRIEHLGFSFHDNYDAFKNIIDAYDNWAFCQIQYNILDTKLQAGTRGLRYAASKGLAVVIMEPLLGGKLANPSESIQAEWDRSSTKRTPADGSLQWLWDQPEISVVLSGMTEMQQVTENLASADASEIGAMTEADLKIIELVQKKYEDSGLISCTGCEYCLPCQNNVNIPNIFRIFNRKVALNDLRSRQTAYQGLPPEMKADNCLFCLECEAKCPQQIPISQWLVQLHDFLELKKSYEEIVRPA